MKNLKTINEFWGAVIRRDMSSAVREEDRFHNKEELKDYLKKEIEKQGENVVIKNLDISGIGDLSNLFRGLLKNVKTLDLSGWNTEGVKSMVGMFHGCNSLESIDLSGWDTSSVEDMRSVFSGCTNLKSIDLSGWSSPNVKDMGYMFWNCADITSLDLSGWNIDGVTDMSHMFCGCENLKSLDLSGWNINKMCMTYEMLCYCPAPYKIEDNKLIKK